MPTYDIAIIGAGPAGSTAAILLARRGYRVALVDRARFPRDKVCGDYLTPGAAALLRDEIGVEAALLAAGAVRVHRQTVVTHATGAMPTALGRHVLAYVPARTIDGAVDALACPRRITDAVLVDEARREGVDVREGFFVREILFDNGRVTGFSGTHDGQPVRIDARVTIGADGTHSLLARRLDLVREIPRLHRLVLSAYVDSDGHDLAMHLPTDRTDACCGLGPSTRSTFSPSPFQGEGWGEVSCPSSSSLPLARGGLGRGSRNVTLVVPVAESTSIAAGRDAYYRRRLATSFPRVWEQLNDCNVPDGVRSTACFGHRTVRAAVDGGLLIGDAATFIHPFTGEGVYYALEGARLAAAAIDHALRAGDVTYRTLRSYDRARSQSLVPRYRLSDAVQHVVHSPALLSIAAELLFRSPALTDQLFQVLGDIAPPSSLLHPRRYSPNIPARLRSSHVGA